MSRPLYPKATLHHKENSEEGGRTPLLAAYSTTNTRPGVPSESGKGPLKSEAGKGALQIRRNVPTLSQPISIANSPVKPFQIQEKMCAKRIQRLDRQQRTLS